MPLDPDRLAEDRRDEEQLRRLAEYERRKSNSLTRYRHGFPPAAGQTLVEVERLAIEHAMELAKGDRAKAATMLGVHRTTLWRKLKARRGPECNL